MDPPGRAWREPDAADTAADTLLAAMAMGDVSLLLGHDLSALDLPDLSGIGSDF